MKTQLIEFSNERGKIIRGILTLPASKIKGNIICVHGFERCATTERKFKTVSDVFIKKNYSVFRLDFSGCGLSDDNFRYTTIEKQSDELIQALCVFQEKTKVNKINIITHSFGACVLAHGIQKIKEQIEKIVLISPALNQKELLRYWFVTQTMKKTNPNIEITWNNYKKHLKEKEFLKDCKRKNKTTKTNYINPDYFSNIKNIDFSENFHELDSKILHIHGKKDLVVPQQSLNIKFSNSLIIEEGDHDLEKPNHKELWIKKTINFLL